MLIYYIFSYTIALSCLCPSVDNQFQAIQIPGGGREDELHPSKGPMWNQQQEIKKNFGILGGREIIKNFHEPCLLYTRYVVF